LRRVPLASRIIAGLVPLSAKGELQCPRAIIQSRAFVAKLKLVRELRPQALPVKLLAIGAASAAANVPMGAWREHQKKFSAQWFLAVHATIPFIAMLRKGVVMPKWAILLTIATAIAGQAVGARLERQRLVTAAGMKQPRLQSGSSDCLRQSSQTAVTAFASVTAAAQSSKHLRGGYTSASDLSPESTYDAERSCSLVAQMEYPASVVETYTPLVFV